MDRMNLAAPLIAFFLAAIMLCVSATLVVLAADVPMIKPVQSAPAQTGDPDETYWTEERLKSAKPIEMPTPATPPPGEDGDLSDPGTQNSVSGSGCPGGGIVVEPAQPNNDCIGQPVQR